MQRVDMPTVEEIEKAIVAGSSMSLYRTCKFCGEVKHYTQFKRAGNNKNHHSKYGFQPITVRRPYCRDCRKNRDLSKAKDLKISSNNLILDYSVLAKILLNDENLSDRDILNLFGTKVFNECVKVRDRYTCNYCGNYGNTVDHVIPLSKGGETSFTNCVCACNECQQRKDNGMR